MGAYILTVTVIFALMVAAIAVERLYKRFQAMNPHLGPFRELDGKCTCHCSGCEEEQNCGH